MLGRHRMNSRPQWERVSEPYGSGLGTRRPSGAARTLINVKNEPKAIRRALAKANEVA